MADASSPSMLSRLIAETFGTFMLVFGVIGAALFISSATGPLAVALGVGLAVMVSAYAVGHISGGHFNPAVSFGAAAAGRMPWKDVAPYLGAQFVGGLLAAAVLFVIGSGTGTSPDFGAVSNGFGALSPGGFVVVAVVVAEFVATLLFVWVILGVTAPGSTTAGFAPLAIGLALTMFHLVLIPVSNASLNPARSLATAAFGGPDALAQLWVFLLVPVLGGLVAGVSFKAVFGRK